MEGNLPVAAAVPNCRPGPAVWLTGAITFLGDAVALGGAGAFAWALAAWVANGSALPTQLAADLWPLLGLFLVGYAACGLYPGRPLFPGSAVAQAEELRRFTMANTTVVATLTALGVLLGKVPLAPPALVLALAIWLSMLVALPAGRCLLRLLLARSAWWGYPVLIFGAGQTGQIVIAALQRRPELGLRPVAVLDDDPDKWGEIAGVPVVGSLDRAEELATTAGVPYAIMAMPGMSRQQTGRFIRTYGNLFRCWLVIAAPSFNFPTLWISNRELWKVARISGPHGSVDVRQWRAKRIADLILVAIGGLVAFPLMALIALLIKLDSPGPVFFMQRRPGRYGRPFTIFKFRTMHADASRRLRELPASQQAEFEAHGKVRRDPRVTRIGTLLRRTSLDELAQIINIIKGEMSLVGPRPYLKCQTPRMNQHKEVVFLAPPGITGLWQISGRSETTIEERMALDAFYVRNWSIWMDIAILTRTVLHVLLGRGAY
ncbi:MAG: exopolysaccharide biosynthesis polyprenyl glycosylphosphotransferase [Phycisphaeraceae bacterium]